MQPADGTILESLTHAPGSTTVKASGGTLLPEGEAWDEAPQAAEEAGGSSGGNPIPTKSQAGPGGSGGGMELVQRADEDFGVSIGGSLRLKDLDGEAMSLERRWAALGRLSLRDRLSPEGAALANRQVVGSRD